ncbi:PAP2-domain-containing protein [Punctularia strigosozonata HHB-11173 SS5]|uniref:PAP2-domain-containing protein n=1 Tax=Punctularia strigosozonata (strain HHB-11173) TaxID=741275 RepID=R7S224_PUNST|nr:PAP2-domain-containing protein [Punctularia strigosozonata HHB-11173 SS5]EIN03832.1 PAP2-domain-containing protein [Punctularia strigosozonata HHB-11173 SS5]
MTDVLPASRASLDLTHVVYDDTSHLSLVLALITLSPVLLMASYAALAVQTRELTIILMWAGQFACEGFNFVLKHIIKQDRPMEMGPGYGFPSSHSQYMGYFVSFLICHLYIRHRFPPSGIRLLDRLLKPLVCLGLICWAGVVAYSRYHLGYHTPHQIVWGLIIGALCGTAFYTVVELIPTRPSPSPLKTLRTALLDHPLAQWLRIRDGWAVYGDGGTDEEWKRWRKQFELKAREECRTSAESKRVH